jgi:hypothetical protein
VSLREEYSLRVSESRVLRRIFGATRDKVEVTGAKSRLHNEKLCNLKSSPNFLGDKITKVRMDGAFSTYGREKRWIQCLVGKPKGKRKFGRHENTCLLSVNLKYK